MTTTWGNETQHFTNLTPDKIFQAVESTGLRCTGRCFTLYSMENRVYSVEIEAPEGGDRWANYRVVKFYRPGRWSRAQIEDEHAFIADLKANEVPVVPALPVGNGSTVGEAFGLYFAIFPRIGGRTPDEISLADLPIVARLMARMHNTGAERDAMHRLHIDPATYATANLKFLLDSKKIPMDLERPYRETVEAIVDTTADWFATAPKQRLHGDCHRGNLLWGNDGPFWIDFDDMVMGPPVQDMWLLIPGFEQPGIVRDTFLQAYEEMRAFDHKTLRLVEPLRALRYVHFAGWIAKRWQDPAFPDAFPDFGSWSYWAEQIGDLKEQLRKIRG